ncbi:MAG: sialate O-acetylesterase [Spirulina sp.]
MLNLRFLGIGLFLSTLTIVLEPSQGSSQIPSGCRFFKPPKSETLSIKLFILAGQSNMVGTFSDLAELPPHLQQTQPNVLWYDRHDRWVMLQPPTEPLPFTRRIDNGEGFGPEISLGLNLANRLGETVALIKYSVNGTNLDREWNPHVEESLYSLMKERIRQGREMLEVRGYSLEVAGFFWMQGESDAKNDLNMALNYEENLRNLILKIRQDFASPNLPFIYGKIFLTNNHQTYDPEREFQYGDVIREAQDRISRMISHTGVVETIDLTRYFDNLHFDSNGLIELGDRMADSWLEVACEIPERKNF